MSAVAHTRIARAAAATGVAATTVVAALDVAITARPVFIPLLVVGPLVAAAGASLHATAAVAALALVVAVGLGPFDEGLFAPQHVVQVLVVLAGGVFALVAVTARTRLEAARRAAAGALAGERTARIEANVVARASELLATAVDPEERLAQVVALAVPETADVGTVDLLDGAGALRGAAADAAEPGVADQVLDARRRWPIRLDSDHPVAVAARTGRPQLVPEMTAAHLEQVALCPEHLEHMRRLRYASGMAVPLVARGRTLGVFAFVRRAGRPPFGDDDLRLGVELARRAATALDNARLFAELSRTERQLEAILTNLAEAVTVQTPDLSLAYVNDAAAELLECASPAEALRTPTAELIGRFTALDEHGGPFDYARMPSRAALAGQVPEPVVLRLVSRATGRERWVQVKATVVRDDDGEITMAVNIIEDVTDARRVERDQRFLAETSKLVSSSLEVETTLDRAAAAMVPMLADWCCVDLPVDRDGIVRRARAVDPARHAELDAARAALDLADPDADGPAAVLRDGRPRLWSHVDDALPATWARDGADPGALRGQGARSVLTVPLIAGTRVLGIITMGTDRSSRVLGDAELELAREVGVRAGIAVENARVHAARSHIATTLQRSLLPPRLPVVPGVTMAARFRAAGGSGDVGGDFYDVFEIDGGWMVVIGDVTGKGPEAASITSLARYTMRTAAAYEPSPGSVLRRLNAALVADPDRRQICTVACARVVAEPDGSATVTIASGGHPPPFRLHDGHAEPAAVGGPLLGAFQAGEWPEAVVRLSPGESLVLYTDGVTDARDGAGRFGVERLAAVLSGVTGAGPDEIVARVDDALRAFEEGPQRDDIALLALRAEG